jgi:uncharacterized RDD family membrane protein YckC
MLLRRVIAGVIDLVPVLLLFVVLSDIVGGARDTGPTGEDGVVIQFNGAPFLLFLVLMLGYYLLLEARTRGRSVGKKLLRLRVVSADGFPASTRQIAVRTLLRVIDWLPLFYLLGFISALTSGGARRLGDRLAGTIVIDDA